MTCSKLRIYPWISSIHIESNCLVGDPSMLRTWASSETSMVPDWSRSTSWKEALHFWISSSLKTLRFISMWTGCAIVWSHQPSRGCSRRLWKAVGITKAIFSWFEHWLCLDINHYIASKKFAEPDSLQHRRLVKIQDGAVGYTSPRNQSASVEQPTTTARHKLRENKIYAQESTP